MIYPHLPVTVHKNLGANAYGEAQYGAAKPEKVCPVRLRFRSATTTVRTDSAGTRGHAEEEIAEIRLLALPTTKIAMDDMLVVTGVAVRVVGREPRYTVTGRLDHYELTCDQKVTLNGD